MSFAPSPLCDRSMCNHVSLEHSAQLNLIGQASLGAKLMQAALATAVIWWRGIDRLLVDQKCGQK